MAEAATAGTRGEYQPDTEDRDMAQMQLGVDSEWRFRHIWDRSKSSRTRPSTQSIRAAAGK